MKGAVCISINERRELLARVTDYLKDTSKVNWSGDQIDELVDLAISCYASGVRDGRTQTNETQEGKR